jgi:hypothetical protein
MEGGRTIDEGREAALGTRAEMTHFKEGAGEVNSFVVKCQQNITTEKGMVNSPRTCPSASGRVSANTLLSTAIVEVHVPLLYIASKI